MKEWPLNCSWCKHFTFCNLLIAVSKDPSPDSYRDREDKQPFIPCLERFCYRRGSISKHFPFVTLRNEGSLDCTLKKVQSALHFVTVVYSSYQRCFLRQHNKKDASLSLLRLK